MAKSAATPDAVRRFFATPYFAVAGASQDSAKFGYKILAWYHAHSLPVTPLNPRAASITVSSTTLAALPSPSSLPHPSQTALSIVTPPAVTKTVLKEAQAAGVKAVWLQPGTYDDEVLEMVLGKEGRGGQFESGIGGMEEIVEEEGEGEGGKKTKKKRTWRSRGGEGWCVLVDGETGLQAAGRLGEAAGSRI